MVRANEISVAEIATAEDMHPVYVAKVLRSKGAPKPTRKVGPAKLFDSREVLAFFDKRRKSGIGRK